jgi:hypothetical protein
MEVLKSLMSLGPPDPPLLSASVRRQHVDAGLVAVRRLEESRVDQAARHDELLLAASNVDALTKRAEGRVRKWSEADAEMDQVAALTHELAEAVAACQATVASVQKRLPELETRLSTMERQGDARRLRELQEQLTESVGVELAQIEQAMESRYRDALQAAFEEQLKRFKESGIAPPPSLARAPDQTIETVTLAADEGELHEMEEFFGKE